MGDQKKQATVDDAAAFDDLFLVLQKDLTDASLIDEETTDAFKWFKRVRYFILKVTSDLNYSVFIFCVFLGLSDIS